MNKEKLAELARKILEKKLPEWLEFKEYHFNVEKYYWETYLRPVWIRTKNIDAVKFIEYVKLPLKEAKE